MQIVFLGDNLDEKLNPILYRRYPQSQNIAY